MKKIVVPTIFTLIFLIGLSLGFSSASELTASSNSWLHMANESPEENVEEVTSSYSIITITILVLLIGAITRVWFVVNRRKKKVRKGGN